MNVKTTRRLLKGAVTLAAAVGAVFAAHFIVRTIPELAGLVLSYLGGLLVGRVVFRLWGPPSKW
jgi:hypothetical protein